MFWQYFRVTDMWWTIHECENIEQDVLDIKDIKDIIRDHLNTQTHRFYVSVYVWVFSMIFRFKGR